MKDNNTQIFALLGKVVAAKGNQKYPEGEKHGVLAIARAASHNNAEAIAVRELDGGGWVYFEAEKIGVIDASNISDKDTVKAVLEAGFHATIYEAVES